MFGVGKRLFLVFCLRELNFKIAKILKMLKFKVRGLIYVTIQGGKKLQRSQLLTETTFATSRSKKHCVSETECFCSFSELLLVFFPQKMAPGPFPPKIFSKTRFTSESKDLNCCSSKHYLSKLQYYLHLETFLRQ